MPATIRKDQRVVQGRETVRYAVVGLGWIAQGAVLPACVPPFRRTRRPTLAQAIERPAAPEPPLLHAAKASGKS